MRLPFPSSLALATACALVLCGGARAQDEASRQAALKTVQKEVGAAYGEAKRACDKGAAGERSACLQRARATWQHELKNAPAQVESARDMGGVTTTTTTTVGTTSTTTVETTPAAGH